MGAHSAGRLVAAALQTSPDKALKAVSASNMSTHALAYLYR